MSGVTLWTHGHYGRSNVSVIGNTRCSAAGRPSRPPGNSPIPGVPVGMLGLTWWTGEQERHIPDGMLGLTWWTDEQDCRTPGRRPGTPIGAEVPSEEAAGAGAGREGRPGPGRGGPVRDESMSGVTVRAGPGRAAAAGAPRPTRISGPAPRIGREFLPGS